MKPWYDRFIIDRDNVYLQSWNIFVSILTVLSCFSNLHVAAFNSNDHQKHDEFIHDEIVFWQLLQEYLFGIDIIVIFLSEYKDMFTGDLVRTFSKIALNYLKTSLIFDLLAFFPFFEIFEV